MKAFRVGRLVDVVGQTVIRQATLLVEHGRITAAGHAAEVAVPPHAEVIDAPGATLLPGLMDAHVHLAYSGATRPGALQAEAVGLSYAQQALRAAAYARQTLEWGFTAVRDLSAPGGTVIDLARAVAQEQVAGPLIRACGLGLSVTGGHMDPPRWGDHVRVQDLSGACDGPEAFRLGVRQQVKRGADFIKINLCVGSRGTALPYRQEMSDEEVQMAVQEAGRLGKSVAAHTSGGPAITAAVRWGLTSVEHGHWLDDETIDLMAAQGTYYVPTLLVNERDFELIEAGEPAPPPAALAWLERARDAKWDSLERAHAAGVKIALGTDAGFTLPHGEMNARELELLVQGGLSPLEAVIAATRTAADLLELPERGDLRVGQVADLLLVEGDPLADVRVLQRQSNFRVFQTGHEVPRRGEGVHA